MVNYANGKVYIIRPIVEHEEGEVYIGSTTKYYLSDRLFNHRDTYEKYKIGYGCGRFSVYDLFDKYGADNCAIYLLENVNAQSKNELHTREGFHITKTQCVNKILAGGRSREEILERKRQYRIDNKEKILLLFSSHNWQRSLLLANTLYGLLPLHSILHSTLDL